MSKHMRPVVDKVKRLFDSQFPWLADSNDMVPASWWASSGSITTLQGNRNWMDICKGAKHSGCSHLIAIPFRSKLSILPNQHESRPHHYSSLPLLLHKLMRDWTRIPRIQGVSTAVNTMVFSMWVLDAVVKTETHISLALTAVEGRDEKS